MTAATSSASASASASATTRDESIQAAKKKLKAYRAKQAQAAAGGKRTSIIAPSSSAASTHTRTHSHSRKPSLVHIASTPTDRRSSRHARIPSIATYRQSVDLKNFNPALFTSSQQQQQQPPPPPMTTAEKRLSRHARNPSIATHRQSVDLMNFNPALIASSQQQQQVPPPPMTTAEKRLSRHARNPSIATHRQSVDLMNFNPALFASSQPQQQQPPPPPMTTAEKRLSRHARNPSIATHRQSVDLMNFNPALFASSQPQQQPSTTPDRSPLMSTVELPGFDDVHGPEAMDKRASTTLIKRNSLNTAADTVDSNIIAGVAFAGPRSPRSPFRDSLKLPRLGSAQQQDVLLPPAGGRQRPQSLYGAPLLASLSADTEDSLQFAGPASSSALAASQSNPDGLSTLTELAEGDEEEESDSNATKPKKTVDEQPQETDELDRLRKQARRASLTPRPLKLKSRPASLFLPSGGLAGAMAHRIDPLSTQRGILPASSSGREMPLAFKRNSLLLSGRMGAPLPSETSSPASSVDSSLVSSITKAVEEPSSAKTSPPKTAAAVGPSTPVDEPVMDGDDVILPGPATATTAAAQAAVGTTTLRQGMRALRLGSIVSATSSTGTVGPPTSSSIMSPTLSASESLAEAFFSGPAPVSAPAQTSAASHSVNGSTSSSPQLPHSASAFQATPKPSATNPGRRSSIVYRSSSNTTSATSSNYGMGIKRNRRTNTADSSASSISPPSSISTTHGGGRGEASASEVSTITVPVVTYEDMCARAAQSDAVRRSLDRTARELAVSEGERLRATAALKEKESQLLEMEEKVLEANEQAEMLNEDVEGWKERCKVAEANLARERVGMEESRISSEVALVAMREWIQTLTSMLEGAGIKVPSLGASSSSPMAMEQPGSASGSRSATGSQQIDVAELGSGTGIRKERPGKLDLMSVLRNPVSSPVSPSLGFSPSGGGYFASSTGGLPSAALATPALIRRAATSGGGSQHGSEGSSGTGGVGGLSSSTPHLDMEATVRLLREMRQQIFNLAGKLEFERKEHGKTKEMLEEMRKARVLEEVAVPAPASGLPVQSVEIEHEAQQEKTEGGQGFYTHANAAVGAVAGERASSNYTDSRFNSYDEIREEQSRDERTLEMDRTAGTTMDHPSYETAATEFSHVESSSSVDQDAARTSSSTPGLEYDHQPEGSGSFSHLRTVREKSAFNSGTFGYDDQLRSIEEGDSLREDVIRRRSDESSVESQGPPSPAEIDLEAQGGEDMYDDGDSAFEDEAEMETPELDIEQWNRPDVVRAWSLSRATAAAKKSRSRAAARGNKGGSTPFATSAYRHRHQPSFEDFFGIMTERRLPALPTPTSALEMPPVYSEYDPKVGSIRLSAGRITSYMRPEVYDVMPGGLPGAGSIVDGISSAAGGLTRSTSLQGGSRWANAAGVGRTGSVSTAGKDRSYSALPKRLSMPVQPKPAQPKRMSATRPLKAFVDARSVPMPQAAAKHDLDFAWATVSGIGPLLQL
ncbi:hypothetical protein A4X13_0g3464 [Tilletia indica]|uniref:Uncharacterized protein n=1 Tax=Tilletia indica TaxID=43049 RepID=A0A177T7R4_9BASI|nr:hypothetical protein A4X13_0g3464 [Tilletia indica]